MSTYDLTKKENNVDEKDPDTLYSLKQKRQEIINSRFGELEMLAKCKDLAVLVGTGTEEEEQVNEQGAKMLEQVLTSLTIFELSAAQIGFAYEQIVAKGQSAMSVWCSSQLLKEQAIKIKEIDSIRFWKKNFNLEILQSISPLAEQLESLCALLWTKIIAIHSQTVLMGRPMKDMLEAWNVDISLKIDDNANSEGTAVEGQNDNKSDKGSELPGPSSKSKNFFSKTFQRARNLLKKGKKSEEHKNDKIKGKDACASASASIAEESFEDCMKYFKDLEISFKFMLSLIKQNVSEMNLNKDNEEILDVIANLISSAHKWKEPQNSGLIGTDLKVQMTQLCTQLMTYTKKCSSFLENLLLLLKTDLRNLNDILAYCSNQGSENMNGEIEIN